MEATKYQLEKTQWEAEQACNDFRRKLATGRSHEAVKQAIIWAQDNAHDLWSFLTLYASTDVNYRETNTVLVVNALRNNWQSYRDNVYIAHAVLTLINAQKGDSLRKFLL